LLLGWLFAACAQAQPQPVFVDPLPDFPAGSIHTVDQAQAALAAVLPARARQLKRRDQQRKACYRKFFAEQCLAQAREDDYQTTHRIDSVEQEAHDFERRNKAAIREKKRADKQAQEQANAARDQAEREKKRLGLERKVERNRNEAADFDAKAGERAQNAAAARKREQDHLAERARKDAEDQAKAPERAEQAREQAAKVEEVLKHAQEREAKQREKEKQKQEKAASQPLKPPQDLEKGDGPL
jgi:hypothetical protein